MYWMWSAIYGVYIVVYIHMECIMGCILTGGLYFMARLCHDTSSSWCPALCKLWFTVHWVTGWRARQTMGEVHGLGSEYCKEDTNIHN